MAAFSSASPLLNGALISAASLACVVGAVLFLIWTMAIKPARGRAIVRELVIYPIKSCAGVRCSSAKVTPRGLENDRLFLIVDRNGHMQTQRVLPAMARIQPIFDESGNLVISIPGHQEITICNEDFTTGNSRKVTVWSSECDSVDQCDRIATALSTYLQKSGLRLVRMADGFVRKVEKGYVKRDVYQTSFSDGYPFLLTNHSSLECVREKSGYPNLHMTRFRPNIVVESLNSTAFEEDGWSEIQIGRTRFEITKMCSRCQIPRIDPYSGLQHPAGEPTRTLLRFRKFGSKVMFGQNVVALNYGEHIMVGDSIQVLSWKDVPIPVVSK